MFNLFLGAFIFCMIAFMVVMFFVGLWQCVIAILDDRRIDGQRVNRMMKDNANKHDIDRLNETITRDRNDSLIRPDHYGGSY